MAYSTENPPALVMGTLGGTFRLWAYKSADAATLVRADGYFTNGYDLGMRAGDLVMSVDTDASPIDLQMMVVNSASATGGVDLTDGTEVAGADTD